MGETEFNLLDEPWILTVDMDCQTAPLSLTDVFARAHELKALAGELPTQDVATLRLLLSIVYAVFTRVDENGAPLEADYDALELWRRLWERQSFPLDVVESYLRRYHDRFWLFHPERPFWQVKFDKENLPVNKNGIKLKPTEVDAPKFIGDISDGDKPNLFGGREQKYNITFSEAARWLIHLNAFDVSPAGNPGKNPKTVKGFGHPWPADIGLVWISGNTLFETLMLNLVLLNNQDYWPEGNAWWETKLPCTNANDLERIDTFVPQSIIELMSMQYRYVTLRREGNFVVGYDLWSGVKFDNDYVFTEQMTPWAISKRNDMRYPRKNNPSRLMWRDFATFVPYKAHDDSPGVMRWIAELKMREFTLPFLSLSIAGIVYKKDTAVYDVFSDSLVINSGLLSALGEEWVERITNLLKTTEKLVDYLGYLAADIADASGVGKGPDGKRKTDGKRNVVKEEGYFCLDVPFRTWLAAINPETDNIDDACKQWLNIVRITILRLGQELVSEAGERAFVGREIKKNADSRGPLMTAPKAYIKFKNMVNKILNAD